LAGVHGVQQTFGSLHFNLHSYYYFSDSQKYCKPFSPEGPSYFDCFFFGDVISTLFWVAFLLTPFFFGQGLSLPFDLFMTYIQEKTSLGFNLLREPIGKLLLSE
jgi:hypothetical protein